MKTNNSLVVYSICYKSVWQWQVKLFNSKSLDSRFLEKYTAWKKYYTLMERVMLASITLSELNSMFVHLQNKIEAQIRLFRLPIHSVQFKKLNSW